jgi:hypothetical protein
MKLRRRVADESRMRSLLTNPISDGEAILRAAGYERREILVTRKIRKPSRSGYGEGSIAGGKETDTRRRFRRGNGGGTQERDVSELVKPSWPRGERPRSKVGVGNSAEGQRVAAEPVVVVNRW